MNDRVKVKKRDIVTRWLFNYCLPITPYVVTMFQTPSLVRQIATPVGETELEVRIFLKDTTEYNMGGRQSSIEGIAYEVP